MNSQLAWKQEYRASYTHTTDKQLTNLLHWRRATHESSSAHKATTTHEATTARHATKGRRSESTCGRVWDAKLGLGFAVLQGNWSVIDLASDGTRPTSRTKTGRPINDF